MPPLPLASALLRSLPWLSARGRAAINFLVYDNGHPSSAESLASRLGLSTRYQLARLLRSEGLPRFEMLTGWISSLYWRLEAEHTDATMVVLSRRSHRALAASYRLVRRVTGRRWSELRSAPTDELLRRFVDQCSPPRATKLRQSFGSTASGAAVPTAPRLGIRGAVRLPLAGAPFAVALHNHREAYVARAHAGALERFDVVERRFVGSVPVGCVPSCITVDEAHQRAYVSLQYEDAIAVIDTRAHAVVGRFSVPGDPFPVLLNRTGGLLYLTTNEDRVHALSLPDGTVAASFPLPATSHFVVLHPAGHRLYVATRSGGTVLELDSKSLRLCRTFELGGEPLDLTVSADGRTLYVVNGLQGLNVVRLTDGQVLRTVRLEGRPTHLAVGPGERTLYLALVEAGAVATVDPIALGVGLLKTGGRPRGLSLTHGRGLVVANETGWVDLLPV